MMKVDEEAAGRANALKALREVETQLSEVNEELEALKNELLENLDVTAAQQELRTARERELANTKKSLEEAITNHEQTMTDMRHKHSQDVSQLNNQLDMVKKTAAQSEKMKGQFEAELADLTNELRSVSGNKQEAERKRKQLEGQVGELNARLMESEHRGTEAQ